MDQSPMGVTPAAARPSCAAVADVSVIRHPHRRSGAN
jgi:hypothetical protein